MFLQVVRAAEETAAMLALSISPDQCIKVLCPIIQSADYPINLAAIKMQTKVVERVPREGLIGLLPEIVPGLIQVTRTHHIFYVSVLKNGSSADPVLTHHSYMDTFI